MKIYRKNVNHLKSSERDFCTFGVQIAPDRTLAACGVSDVQRILSRSIRNKSVDIFSLIHDRLWNRSKVTASEHGKYEAPPTFSFWVENTK